MRDWVIAMKDYHGPDYINFWIWASIFRGIRDKALYCVDFLGELAVSDGIERIQKLQQWEDTNLQ